MKPISKECLSSTAFLSLVLSALIFCATLFALKLDFDVHYSKEQHPSAAQSDRKATDEEPRVFGVGAEGWTAIFTGGLLFSTMGLAFFTYRLFEVTNDGLNRQEELTRKSLRHAEASARAAESAIREANISSQRQLRAYIGIDEGALSFVFKGADTVEANVRITIRNFGATPAKDTEVVAGVAVGRSARSHPKLRKIPGKSVLFPSVPHALKFGELIFKVPTKQVYVIGIINYTDSFGERRYTKFCLQAMNKEEGGATFYLAAADEGNDFD